jgi:hypothetical protein
MAAESNKTLKDIVLFQDFSYFLIGTIENHRSLCTEDFAAVSCPDIIELPALLKTESTFWSCLKQCHLCTHHTCTCSRRGHP